MHEWRSDPIREPPSAAGLEGRHAARTAAAARVRTGGAYNLHLPRTRYDLKSVPLPIAPAAAALP